MPQETYQINPPLGGINRAFGFQKQPPFTAIDILNMWPFNPADGRQCLATRPPLQAIESPGEDVNLLSPITAGGSGKLQQGLVAAAGGDLFYWNGDSWVPATGDEADDIPTGAPVYATPLGKFLVIPTSTDMLVYDYSTNVCETLVASAGFAPTGVIVLCTHLGSVMAAGTEGFENVLYSSRTGDHTDWDYTATDTGRPFSTDIETSGRVNEPIGALVPFSADRMVIGCPNSMYVMLGHLSRGGQIDVLSPSIGILGNGAWCLDANGNMYFMSKSGMGVLPANNNSQPTLISDTKMPDQLRGLAYEFTAPNIAMAYSSRWNVVYITVTGDQAQSWMYDIKTGGFQRMSFANYPTVMMGYEPFMSFNHCNVLWGGSGYGGLSQFDRLGTEADRPTYRCIFGPIRLSQDSTRKARIKYLRCVLGANTNDTTGVLVLYTGTDGEDAFTRAFNNLSARRYGADFITLLRNNGSCYPRLDGHALVVVIAGSGDNLCIFENMDITVQDAGLNRDQRVIGFGYDFSGGIDDYDAFYGGGYNNKFGEDGKPKYGGDDDTPDDDGPFGDDDVNPYDGFGGPLTPTGFITFTF